MNQRKMASLTLAALFLLPLTSCSKTETQQISDLFAPGGGEVLVTQTHVVTAEPEQNNIPKDESNSFNGNVVRQKSNEELDELERNIDAQEPINVKVVDTQSIPNELSHDDFVKKLSSLTNVIMDGQYSGTTFPRLSRALKESGVEFNDRLLSPTLINNGTYVITTRTDPAISKKDDSYYEIAYDIVAVAVPTPEIIDKPVEKVNFLKNSFNEADNFNETKQRVVYSVKFRPDGKVDLSVNNEMWINPVN